MHLSNLVSSLTLLALCMGCCASLPEPAASELVLLSVSPRRGAEAAGFHDYPILGELSVTGDDAAALLDALSEGLASAPQSGAKCFDPRHGLRITEGAATVEHLICFECSWIYTFEGGEGGRRSEGRRTTIAKSPRELFNRLLTEAGIPLAD